VAQLHEKYDDDDDFLCFEAILILIFFASIILLVYFVIGDRGGTVVKALRNKSEGRWFGPSWCHWNFSLT
jgi:hypothetical protein